MTLWNAVLGNVKQARRIIQTLGHKMMKLHPINGFAAETSSAIILFIAAHYQDAGVNHAQHFDCGHGRGLCEEPSCA